MKIAIALHILSAVIWVGGMFFAYMALRPASISLEAGVRLNLWGAVFDRFFRWVWIAIILLLVSGYWIIYAVFGGMSGIGMYIHLMQTTGITMMIIFMHVYFAPYRRFKRALISGDTALAAKNLNQIRIFVAINLILGLLTIIIGSTGRHW